MQKIDGLNILHFDSVAELGLYTQLKNVEEKVRNDEFTGGLPLFTAQQYCINGDASNVANAEKLLSQFQSEIETTIYVDTPSVAGCYPVVPEALAGDPECMREPELIGDTGAPITIVVDIMAQASISATQMRSRGIAILALVMALSASRPVTLRLAYCSHGEETDQSDGDRMMLMTVAVNTAPLDLASAAYAITHASFLRRVCFGLAYQYGFNGCFARFNGLSNSSPDSQYYIDRVKRYLGISDEMLYIPAAMCANSELLTSPTTWVRKQLEKFGAREAEF